MYFLHILLIFLTLTISQLALAAISAKVRPEATAQSSVAAPAQGYDKEKNLDEPELLDLKKTPRTFSFESQTPQRVIVGCRGAQLPTGQLKTIFYIIDSTGRKKYVEPGQYVYVVFPPAEGSLPTSSSDRARAKYVGFHEMCFPTECNAPNCGFTIGPLPSHPQLGNNDAFQAIQDQIDAIIAAGGAGAAASGSASSSSSSSGGDWTPSPPPPPPPPVPVPPPPPPPVPVPPVPTPPKPPCSGWTAGETGGGSSGSSSGGSTGETGGGSSGSSSGGSTGESSGSSGSSSSSGSESGAGASAGGETGSGGASAGAGSSESSSSSSGSSGEGSEGGSSSGGGTCGTTDCGGGESGGSGGESGGSGGSEGGSSGGESGGSEGGSSGGESGGSGGSEGGSSGGESGGSGGSEGGSSGGESGGSGGSEGGSSGGESGGGSSGGESGGESGGSGSGGESGGESGGSSGSTGGSGGSSGGCPTQCNCCHLCPSVYPTGTALPPPPAGTVFPNSNPFFPMPVQSSFMPGAPWASAFASKSSIGKELSKDRTDTTYYASLPGAIIGAANVIYYPSCERDAYVQPAIINYCPASESTSVSAKIKRQSASMNQMD